MRAACFDIFDVHLRAIHREHRAQCCCRGSPRRRQAPCFRQIDADRKSEKEHPSFVDTSSLKDIVKDTLWITVLYSVIERGQWSEP